MRVFFLLALLALASSQTKKIHNDYLSRFAELGDVPPGVILAAFDLDKDGKVEQHEVSRLLDSMDSDWDGTASAKEIAAWSVKYKNIAKNSAAFVSLMSKIPGIIVSPKDPAALTHDHSQLERCKGTGCSSKSAAQLQEQGFSRPTIEHIFKHFDLDGDKVIEPHEMHALIDFIDTDDSGTVSSKELDEYFGKHKHHVAHKDSFATMLGWENVEPEL